VAKRVKSPVIHQLCDLVSNPILILLLCPWIRCFREALQQLSLLGGFEQGEKKSKARILKPTRVELNSNMNSKKNWYSKKVFEFKLRVELQLISKAFEFNSSRCSILKAFEMKNHQVILENSQIFKFALE